MMKKNAYQMTENAGADAFSNEGLSFEEEIEFSKSILAGEAAKKKLAESDTLNEEERNSLENAVRTGDQAYERLVMANVPRAMKAAFETFRKNPFGLNEIDDYRQTAMKVVCTCARTYDWKLGCRFGTYVQNSLKNEMVRENARTGYALRIPEENLCRLNALKQQKEGGKADRMEEKDRKSAEKLISLCMVSRSLDEPAGCDGSGMDFGEMIEDPNALTAEMIEDGIIDLLQTAKLMEALEALPEDEKELLKGRMGFEGDPLPMKAYVGIYAKSISGVQKKQKAAEKHLREVFFSLPEGRLDFLNTLLFFYQRICAFVHQPYGLYRAAVPDP